MEEGDQQQDHQGGGDRRPEPGDEGGVIAAAMRDDLGGEPKRQRHQRDGGDTLRPPGSGPFLAEPSPIARASEERMGCSDPRLCAVNELTTQATTVSTMDAVTTAHPEM